MSVVDPGSKSYTRIVALNVTGTAFLPTRAIIADAAGTGSVTDAEGNTVTLFPLLAQVMPISVTKINTLATTAHVWGLY